MDVKIGVLHTVKELTLEVETPFDDLQKSIEAALRDNGVLWLNDRKGRRICVPADRIAYVEVGEEASRRVGFGPS
jgi:hypothetical protein